MITITHHHDGWHMDRLGTDITKSRIVNDSSGMNIWIVIKVLLDW